MPPERTTEHELAYFPDIWDSPAVTKVFLMIRNTTLATWHLNPTQECTFKDVLSNLKPPFDSDQEMIKMVIKYLSRFGLINFGRYERRTVVFRRLPEHRRKVVVLGAGAAGIAAASQLHTFGFDVILLEAKGYVGGRAKTVKSDGEIIEFGCDGLSDFEDSPLATLVHQIQCEVVAQKKHISMFLDGKMLNEARQKTVETFHKTLHDSLSWLAHEQPSSHFDDGQRVSRQRVYENVFSMIDRRHKISYFNWCKTLEELALAREKHFETLNRYRRMAMCSEKKLQEEETEADRLLRRSLKRDIFTLIQRFETEQAALIEADSLLEEHKKKPVPEHMMHPRDFSNCNFLLGFEEYLYGAPLESVQFSLDAHNCKRADRSVKLTGGIGRLLTQVLNKREINVRLKHRVREINYTGDKVTLKVELESGEIVSIDCNYLVSTLPIGVLKASVSGDDAEVPKFVPELPEKMKAAIDGIGCGLVTKLILTFEENFWAQGGRDDFFTIQPHIHERGYMAVWTSLPGSKTLTTYIAGNFTHQSEPELMLVKRAMVVLRQVFPLCPDLPKSYCMTKWEEDPFALCSGSFMGLNTEMQHFEDIIQPIATPDGRRRIYFAGEHTQSSRQGTLEGAWISGCRQAANLANQQIGVDFVRMDRFDKEDEMNKKGTKRASQQDLSTCSSKSNSSSAPAPSTSDTSRAPAVKSAASTTKSTAPTAKAMAPTVESKASTVKSATSTTKSTAPTAKATAPTVESKAPTAKATAQTVESKAPTAKATAPTVESKAPTAKATAPTDETKAPTAKSAASITKSTAPTAKATAPTVESEVSTAKDTASTTKSTAPTGKASTTKSTASTPKAAPAAAPALATPPMTDLAAPAAAPAPASSSEKRRSIKKLLFDPTPVPKIRGSAKHEHPSYHLEDEEFLAECTEGPSGVLYAQQDNASSGSMPGTSGPTPIQYLASHNRVPRGTKEFRKPRGK